MDVTHYAVSTGQWAEPVMITTLGMMMVLPVLWLLTNVLTPLLPAVRVVRTRLLPGLTAAAVQRRINRTPVTSDARELCDGTVARLRGKVGDASLIRAAGRAGNAVVCRQLARNALGGVLAEDFLVRDFDLLLPDGCVVRARAEAASELRALVLLDDAEDRWAGQGLARAWFCESRLHPGEDVEVVGTLLREIDLEAQAHSFRRAAVRWTVIAGPAQPLILRFSTVNGTARSPRVTAALGAPRRRGAAG
jgi:hypothetical protein